MDGTYQLHAELCKVFANPTRLEIVDHLRSKELSVTKLVEKIKRSQANISQHLAIMKYKGIVTSRRNGTNIYYALTNPKIVEAFDIIREVLAEKKRKIGE